MKIPLDLLDLPFLDLRASIDEEALEELAASMRDNGQLQPIGAKKKPDGRFEVVYGARRTRAARLNNWTEIEAHEVSDDEPGNAAAKKLIENVQRQDLTPIEEAFGLMELIGEGIRDVSQLRRQTGKSREWIKTRLALIDMPEDLQGALQAGVINIGVALALATIEDNDIRSQYTQYAVDNGATTDQVKAWAGTAQYAATGLSTMDEVINAVAEQRQTSGPVELMYQCFNCGDHGNSRSVMSVIICTGCHEHIATRRPKRQIHREPAPL